jgi:hypothetical protein
VGRALVTDHTIMLTTHVVYDLRDVAKEVLFSGYRRAIRS